MIQTMTMLSPTRRLPCLLLLALLAPIVVMAYQNEPEGFRGIKWGAEIKNNAAEMTLIGEEYDKRYYTRRGDKLSIGGAKLTNISYIYWKGALFGVGLRTVGKINKIALIETFEAQFGRPKKTINSADSMEKYGWDGTVTMIGMKCEQSENVCETFLTSYEKGTQQIEELKKAAAGAKKDF